MKGRNKIVSTLCLCLLVASCYSQQFSTVNSIKETAVSFDDYKWAKFNVELLEESSILEASKFSAASLPFFCKMEHQLQLKSRIPVRIRLGNVDYVNKMESKH